MTDDIVSFQALHQLIKTPSKGRVRLLDGALAVLPHPGGWAVLAARFEPALTFQEVSVHATEQEAERAARERLAVEKEGEQ